ncbi:MAG: hypothetical protein HY613_03775 [Candidatus Rokubacteria bacterium]|nr:hypothetical protein [Candidatus Rokubacteria bacterium]
MDEAPRGLVEQIREILHHYEEELIPHEPGTPCPLSVEVPMITPCEFYRTLAGVESVCRDCLGCMGHCACWEDDPDDEE